MSEIAIRVENLGKKYYLAHQQQSGRRYKALRDVLTDKAKGLFSFGGPKCAKKSEREEFWAVKDVSFEIKQGDAVGIIGRNGAGKSTLLKLLSRITEPTTGRIELEGQVASLLEVGTGFHPELTGRENIFLNGAIMGMKGVDIRKKFDEIVDFAEVEKFLDTPVKRYSSGMYMRLAFAVAAHLEPEILVVDEVLAVGDSGFQKKCLGKMGQVSTDGRTVLFVSHNMDAITRLCSRAILMRGGEIVDAGSVRDVVNHYTINQVNQPAKLPFSEFAPVEHTLRNLSLVSADWPPSVSHAPWTVPFGEPISFSILVHCCKPVRHAELGIALYAPSGTEIASTSSIVAVPDADLSPGTYRFSVTYQTLKLVPNTYTFGVGLKSDFGKEDHYPRSFSIDVLPSNASAINRADTFWGYVVPDVAYEIHSI